MKFRVIEGKHHQGGKSYYKGGPNGDVVESKVDLAAKFANKFVRVDDQTSEPRDRSSTFDKPDVTDNPTKHRDKVAADKQDGGTGTSVLGEDVTEDFELAKENGLVVFKDGKNFNVVEPEAIDKPLNPKPLKQSAVDKFVEDYVAGN